MINLLESYSKIKIEYRIKVTLNDSSISEFYGKFPFYSLKSLILEKFKLNKFFEIDDEIFLKFCETKIAKIELKGILFDKNTFKIIDLNSNFNYDKKEIEYNLEELLALDFLNYESIKKFKSLQKMFSDYIILESENKNIDNKDFIDFATKEESRTFEEYNTFIASEDNYVNVFPKMMNNLGEAFSFLRKKDIYDPIDFLQIDCNNILQQMIQQHQLFEEDEEAKIDKQIKQTQEMNRLNESYKIWADKKRLEREQQSTYKQGRFINNGDDDNYNVDDYYYGGRYCESCMESPCQCSDNSDFQ